MRPETTTTVLLIGGMRTIACGERIASALRTVVGVTRAEVDFWSARATVSHRLPCDSSKLARAVEKMGYDASIDGNARGHLPDAAGE